jgi:phosphoribosylformylglycinamidine synthase
MDPKVCVVRTAGTNCDKETAFAFSVFGCDVELVHINMLVSGKVKLSGYHILALPGGFTYGDDIAAGKVMANELRFKLAPQLQEFIAAGKLVIGICNGFQILVKSGFLPGNEALAQEVSLINNDSGSFQDEWVNLKSPEEESLCVWARNLAPVISLPIAHGEGKFIVKDQAVLDRIKANGQAVFRYCSPSGELEGHNPNGSLENIAGICDSTGRVLGLMPHPERYLNARQHPRWKASGEGNAGDGFFIFRNGAEYVRKTFCR